MKKILKRTLSLFMAVITLSACVSFSAIDVEAATKNCGMIIRVYDGSSNYSGRYQCRSETNFGKVGLFGKKVKIEFVNFSSQLNSSQVNFYKDYARFNVCVCDGNTVKKCYTNMKIGDTFKIPMGKNMSVCIDSRIDSSGWKQFSKQMKSKPMLPWSFAQYRLKY